MLYYHVLIEPQSNIEPGQELKFFEWLNHLKKTGRVTAYWPFKDKPGFAAVLRLNFESDLQELLSGWRERWPSEFKVDQLKSQKALDAELARKLIGG